MKGQSGMGFPKPRPQFLDRRDRKATRTALDVKESTIVKDRSGGRCEVFVLDERRCGKRATEVHHLLGGIGVRGRGRSALAIHKQHICAPHHRLITGHVLRLVKVYILPSFDDPYEKRR